MSEYIFAHFLGEEEKEGEQIYFATSKDGLFWEEVNDGKPVLKSNIGTCGVRDPFLVKHPKTETYFIIATDLRIEGGRNWQDAKRSGSRDLLVWESKDCRNWSEVRAHSVGVPECGCVWAPEAIYDREKELFFVFFASWMGKRETGEGKQKIYACYTRNFRDFTEPFLYMERENDVIDTTIVEADKTYFRISKDETTKKLILEEGNSLTGTFRQIQSELLNKLTGIEGPQCYQLPDKRWCLIADCYSKGTGYFPMVTKNLHSGEFTLLDENEYNMGNRRKRHGGVLYI